MSLLAFLICCILVSALGACLWEKYIAPPDYTGPR